MENPLIKSENKGAWIATIIIQGKPICIRHRKLYLNLLKQNKQYESYLKLEAKA